MGVMKLNWKPSQVAFLDFETQSEVELQDSTRLKFAKDKSTRALTCVVKRDGVVHKFGPYLDAAAKERLAAVTEGATIVAHNAPFDESIWTHTEGLPEREWYDTIPPCRAAGLPGALEQLGQELEGRGKDPNGKRLIDMLCKVRNGKVPAIGPAHGLLMDYNVRDVDLLETVFHRSFGYGDPDRMTVDRVINDRGMPTCVEFLMKLKDLFESNKRIGDAVFQEKYKTKATARNAVLAWANKKGFHGLSGLNKAAIKQLEADPFDAYEAMEDDSDFAADYAELTEMLRRRADAVSVGPGKVARAVQAVDEDARMRDQFVVYGAGPGRWSGRQLQPHNLPSVLSRSVDLRKVDLDYDAVQAAALEAGVPAADILSGMLRHIVQADALSVADYSQVEARCVAWLAKEERMAGIFADVNRSIYVDMGEKLYGRTISKKNDQQEYVLCKALVLGCTYGMSGKTFEHTCNNRGEHKALATMTAAGMSANDAVKIYRTAYPAIPALWKAYGCAVLDVVNRVLPEVHVGRCHIFMKGEDMHIVLPSGRPIVYRKAHMEMVVPKYQIMYGMEQTPVPTVVYENMRRARAYLYGSKVCENVSQGTCNDLLALALHHLDQEGLLPVLHVHDEAGAMTDKLDRVLEIMSYQPEWAKGFPILVEGYCGPIWTKNTKGYREGSALNGRML